jgi:hypothetical protein
MTTLRTQTRLPRAARGAAIAVVLALVVAAPAAAATTPTRIVRSLHPFVMDAGTACSFPVAGVPVSGFVAVITFPDGHEKRSIHAKGYYENLDTGKRYWVNDTWSELDVYDPATNILVITTSGLGDYIFWPGDAGPFGETMTTAGFYRIAGMAVNTVDFNANRTSEFTWSGQIIDLCAALS